MIPLLVALALIAERPLDLAELGEALLRAGRPEQALVVLEPLAARDDTPARALKTLGRLREARGRIDEALALRARALAAAPDDREVLFWASGLAATRAESIELLERYLARSAGDEAERIESARASIGVYRALGERPVWTRVEQPARVELPLTLTWDDSGRLLGYVIRVRLGPKKKPARLLLDTGSNGLHLLERVARKAGFEPLADDVVFGGGGDKRHETRRGIFARCAVGELVFGDALASTTRTELDPYGRFHGVMGISVLAGYRLTIDLDDGKLVLTRDGEESAARFDGVPYWVLGGQMLVRAEAGGGESGLFLFDTGASETYLSTSFAARLDGARRGASTTVRTYGGRVEGSTVGGVAVSFEGETTPGEVLSVVDLTLRSRLGRVEISGYLGLDLLAGRRIVVDTATRRLRVVRGGER